jgi:hypothetical protein
LIGLFLVYDLSWLVVVGLAHGKETVGFAVKQDVPNTYILRGIWLAPRICGGDG